MLVVEPAKRYTIQQVRAHKWMQGSPATSATPPTVNNSVANSDDPCENILQLMQRWGIDSQKTRQSLANDSYDNYSAIYLLLRERVTQREISHERFRQVHSQVIF